MVFSSHLFLFYFLPLALATYYLSPKRARHLLLTLTSYVFYGWANPLFVVLMLTTTLLDYLSGLIIADQWRSAEIAALTPGGPRSRLQRSALVVSIVLNLSLLGFFKYFNFGIDSFNALLDGVGASQYAWRTFLRITLPLGISFYTFQSLSYTIDVYRGDARAIRSLIDFACYVAMFPQLVAGPIIRFQEVADQLQERSHTLEKFARGAAFLSLGLGKKILVANPCGQLADTAFNAAALPMLDAWIGAVGYAFQIYFDFSGYSDMAVGLGLMLGFVFAKNFDAPYLSASITEFWSRWHISLSVWLRDYLYIPLGGNRLGAGRTCVNLMLVMLLGGLWHGAAGKFMVWGGLHGGLLILERISGKQPLYASLPRPVRVAVTFLVLCVTWVFFRADTLDQGVRYCRCLAGLETTGSSAWIVSGLIRTPYLLGAVLSAALITWSCPQTWEFTRRLSIGKIAFVAAVFWVSLMMLTAQSYNPFIYFIF